MLSRYRDDRFNESEDQQAKQEKFRRLLNEQKTQLDSIPEQVITPRKEYLRKPIPPAAPNLRTPDPLSDEMSVEDWHKPLPATAGGGGSSTAAIAHQIKKPVRIPKVTVPDMSPPTMDADQLQRILKNGIGCLTVMEAVEHSKQQKKMWQEKLVEAGGGEKSEEAQKSSISQEKDDENVKALLREFFAKAEALYNFKE